MAAAAMMEAYINGLTQGKIKEYMEKNKSNLEKHIKKTIPATRDLAQDLSLLTGVFYPSDSAIFRGAPKQ